jgi:protein gp37
VADPFKLKRGLGNWSGRAVPMPHQLAKPLGWKAPRRVFVNSMSDLFHPTVPDDYIAAVFGVMAACPQHTFQVLTKHPERAARWFAGRWFAGQRDGGPPLPNVWLGASVEDQRSANERISRLLKCPAAVRWVSYEPALGPVDFTDAFSVCDRFGEPSGPRCDSDGSAAIKWVVVGGESGPGARPFNVEWARDTIRQCREAGVPVFVKQLGARPYEDHGVAGRWEHRLRDRKGGDPSEWPGDLQVREWPEVAS